MKKFCFALCLLLALCSKAIGETNTLWNETNVDRLKTDLLKNYDRFSRPENYNVPTKLMIAMTVIHMDLDETRGVLETHAWMRMNWSDSKLKWDPAQYDGIKELKLNADEIWQPDLTVYNSAEATIMDHFAKTNKLSYSNGMVLWVPTSKFQSYCKMELKFWPFDDQECTIKFGSWTYGVNNIDLQVDTSNPVDISNYMEATEWEILSGTAELRQKKYDCCDELYPDVTFKLKFRRRSAMFKAIAVVPAVVVVFMTLTAFWLPPQAGEKLLLNGFACVMISILLMYFSKLLPILAASSPLIVTFYSNTLYLLCGSFTVSVIVINLSRNIKTKPVSKSIKAAFLDGFIGKVFGGSSSNTIVMENQNETPFEDHVGSDDTKIMQPPSHTKATLIQNDWIRLAVVIDRIFFVIYVILFILMGFLHFI